MKNLKKLSVVLMITTLFSASFTSCIDNEVSPVVEAIYEAQADLIAAQSTVQNAQAALLSAQADAAQAQATLLLAQADAAADLAEGQLAALLAEAGLTDAQAALIMAQSVSLADLTAAEVTAIIAEAGLTDAQAAMIMAQATSLADLTAAQVIALIADAGLTDAQAALVMAEAAALADMTEAEVAVLMADAGLTEARMLRIMAEIARYEAESMFMAAKNDQELLLLVAQTARKVAAEQYKLDLAQIQFDIDMNKLMDELAAQNAGMAVKYAAKYTWAMQQVNNLQSTKLQKENWVATQELMLANSELTLQSALAAFQQTIDVKTAEIATKQAAIVDYQSIIDDPASLESRVTELQEETTMLRAENDALAIEIVEVQNAIQDLYNEYDASFDMEDEYDVKYEFLMDRMEEKQVLVDENERHVERIAEIQAALDTYDATTTTLEDAVTAAETAEGLADAAQIAAQTALVDAKDLRDLAVQASDDADQDVTDAMTALGVIEGKIAQLEDEYQTQIAAFAAAQVTYDNGVSAQAAQLILDDQEVIDAQAAIDALLIEYAALQVLYEDDPTQLIWEDGVDTYGDPTFQSSNIGDNDGAVAFAEVLTWQQYSGDTDPDKWEPATWSTTYLDAIPVDGAPGLLDVYVDWHNKFTTDPYIWTGAKDDANRTFFIEVGTDDTSTPIAVLYDAVVEDLGDDDIFDVDPELGDTPYGATDAYERLWDAQLAVLETQDALDNFETNYLAAKALYEEWRDLWEDQLGALEAARLVVSDAEGIAATAQTAEDDAEAAVVTARQARNAADVVLADAMQDTADAEAALADWLATTEEQWMNRIANREAQIAANDVFIAELDILITKAQSEVDELQAAYDAAMASPYRAQLLVDIYEQYDMLWAKEGQIEANGIQIRQNRDIAIAMFGAIRDIVNHEDLMEMISDCNDAIAVLEGEIVTVEAQIAAAIASGAVDAASWQAWIDLAIDTIADLDVEIANYMTIADEYYGLMTAALED